MDDTQPANWVREVLSFWFDEVDPKSWFVRDDDVDSAIKARFSACHRCVAQSDVSDLLVNADTALASIIVLDQFSRNLFRGSARAFSYDELALRISREAISLGFDQRIEVSRRIFVFLPFEHSENLADQDESVRLIASLGDETFNQYAKAHRDVIVEFGRFPHRNDSLGRVSNAAEVAYLAKPGSGF